MQSHTIWYPYLDLPDEVFDTPNGVGTADLSTSSTSPTKEQIKISLEHYHYITNDIILPIPL
jgi:hypothetical protein